MDRDACEGQNRSKRCKRARTALLPDTRAPPRETGSARRSLHRSGISPGGRGGHKVRGKTRATVSVIRHRTRGGVDPPTSRGECRLALTSMTSSCLSTSSSSEMSVSVSSVFSDHAISCPAQNAGKHAYRLAVNAVRGRRGTLPREETSAPSSSARLVPTRRCKREAQVFGIHREHNRHPSISPLFVSPCLNSSVGPGHSQGQSEELAMVARRRIASDGSDGFIYHDSGKGIEHIWNDESFMIQYLITV